MGVYPLVVGDTSWLLGLHFDTENNTRLLFDLPLISVEDLNMYNILKVLSRFRGVEWRNTVKL
jgi:hypothetical protein